jgi:phage tail tape-measure protein
LREQIDILDEVKKKYERASVRYLNMEKDAGRRTEVSNKVGVDLDHAKEQAEDAMKRIKTAEEELRKMAGIA